MIYLIFSLGPWIIVGGDIAKINKCIVSWKVMEINITEQDYPSFNVLVKWIDWEYNLQPSSKLINIYNEWGYDAYARHWQELPFNVWDEVDFLVEKDAYWIISDKKISDWEYYIYDWRNSSEWNFEICEPNAWEDTEIQRKMRNIHSYLNELSYNKPRTAKKLQIALKNLNLSSFTQETNILVLYAREILKKLVESL
jgi:hypothetical protein